MAKIVKLRNYTITQLQNRRRSRGYILISLMLFMALLAIAALTVLPQIKFQAERDREEEMIHRGVAYERGIRRFYRKFGRYPMRIEDLQDTNNLRFIRKRYTDPINVVEGKEQDFKVLHMGDVHINIGIGAGPAAGVPVNGAPGMTQGTAQQTQQGQPTASPDASGTGSGGAAVSVTPQTGSDASDTSSSSSSSGSSSSGFNGPTFGGGPILGVVSASKKKAIREFCNKTHYKDWLFVYDPTMDRGGTLNGPWCPLAVPTGAGFNQPGMSPALPNTGAPGTQAPVQPSPGGPGGTPPVQPNPGGNMPPEQ